MGVADKGRRAGGTGAAASNSPLARILPSVQVLRGLAALSVAFHHIVLQAGIFVGRPGEAAYAWLQPLPWEAGVDVFFVISGFVLVWSSVPLFGQTGSAWVFAGRRVARVVPLYWAATTLVLATALVWPGGVSEAAPDAALVATSFLFLPWKRPDGSVQPLFRLGWTLNYEMLFYAVFALFVPLRARVAVPCLVGVICSLAGLGWMIQPKAVALAFWTDPVILEFALGAALGAVAGQVRLPGTLRAGLVLAGLAGLKVAAALPQVPHGMAFGLPCLALVAGAVLGHPCPGQPGVVWVAAGFGDMSYALYLVHPFPMRALALIWPKAGMAGSVAGVMGYVAAAVGVSVVLAWGVHVWVERPLTEAARRVLRG